MRGSWRLILPGRTYRPAPATDDPVAQELRALAERDLAAGHSAKDWTDEERERWLGTPSKYRVFADHYDPVRWPKEVLAPPALRDQVVVIAVLTIAAAYTQDVPASWWAALVYAPMWEALGGIEQAARRRSAQRLGLTAETAPRPALAPGTGFALVVGLGLWARRPHDTWRQPWSVYLAARLIATSAERRSWRRALHRSRTG